MIIRSFTRAFAISAVALSGFASFDALSSTVNPSGTGLFVELADEAGQIFDVWATPDWNSQSPSDQVPVTGMLQGIGTEGDIDFSWDVKYNPDPFLLVTFTLKNLSANTKTFSLNSSVPVSPAIPGAVYYGGSLITTVSDTSNNGFAQVAGVSGGAIFDGMIDSASTLLLGAISTSCASGGGGCTNTTSDSEGLAVAPVNVGDPLPLPSLLDNSLSALTGPSTDIGIDLDFTLTSGDTATFVGYFEVQAVPVPAAAWLFMSSIIGLAVVRRK